MGEWGFYSLPHGDHDQHNPPGKDCTIPDTCGDGFAGTSSEVLFGVGGWFSSNTQSAQVRLSIDGVPVDFGAACDPDDCVITAFYRFFGAIDTAGFTSFIFDETAGTLGDQEFLFGDDFTFAVAADATDSDGDGVPDTSDNCIDVQNSGQLDTDGDDYGNACDCDFDQNLRCNISDFNVFLPDFAAALDSGVGTDMDGNGSVGIADFNLFLPGFAAGVPGPSGLVP